MGKFQRIFVLNEPNAPRLNPALAVEIGLNESVIFLQMEFWISISNHVFDDEAWTYQSLTNIESFFPFWSKATISRAIRKIENLILLKSTTKYNKKPLDKTRWFAINPVGVERLKSIELSTKYHTPVKSGDTTLQNETSILQNETGLLQNETPNAPVPYNRENTETTTSETPSPPFPWQDFKALLPDGISMSGQLKARIEKAVNKEGRTIAQICEALAYTTAHNPKPSGYKAYFGKCLENGYAVGFGVDSQAESEIKLDDVASLAEAEEFLVSMDETGLNDLKESIEKDGLFPPLAMSDMWLNSVKSERIRERVLRHIVKQSKFKGAQT